MKRVLIICGTGVATSTVVARTFSACTMPAAESDTM